MERGTHIPCGSMTINKKSKKAQGEELPDFLILLEEIHKLQSRVFDLENKVKELEGRSYPPSSSNPLI